MGPRTAGGQGCSRERNFLLINVLIQDIRSQCSLPLGLASPRSAPSPDLLNGNLLPFFFFFFFLKYRYIKKQTPIFKEACNFPGDGMFTATICLVLIKHTCPLIPFYFASQGRLVPCMGLQSLQRDGEGEKLPEAVRCPSVCGRSGLL